MSPDATPVVHDLSFEIPVEHFRWAHERSHTQLLSSGDPFTTTRFAMSAHGFTHADAPAHVVEGAPTIEALDAAGWVGSATVLDLSGVAAGEAVEPSHLQAAARVAPLSDILLLRTGWDRRRAVTSAAYWTEAPYLSRAAAEWLSEQRPRCVGFDFPQDRAIGDAMRGASPAPEEFVTHDVLLRSGVLLLEYLRGLSDLPRQVYLVAAPLRLAGSDGAPCRALALVPDPTDTTTERHLT